MDMETLLDDVYALVSEYEATNGTEIGVTIYANPDGTKPGQSEWVYTKEGFVELGLLYEGNGQVDALTDIETIASEEAGYEYATLIAESLPSQKNGACQSYSLALPGGNWAVYRVIRPTIGPIVVLLRREK